MKKIRKIFNNKVIGLLIISAITFIIGLLGFNLMKGIIFVVIADILYFASLYFIKNKSKIKKKTSKTKSSSKTPNKKVSKIKKKKKRKKIFKILLLLFFIICIAVAAFIGYYVYTVVQDAPTFKADELYSEESTIIYDKDGNVIAELGSELREVVSYDELPEVLVNAIIATEDSNFFVHNGVDLTRFLVASFKQVLTGGGGGASTLTMQLSKLTFTSKETTIKRKLTDMYVSMFNIEQEYTKEEILEFYVNKPYLGGSSYGVEQACNTYFNKSVSEINLSEAALIAGLFQAPGGYDPTKYPEKAEGRRKTVLYLMHRHGYITDIEYEIALDLTTDKLIVSQEEETTDNTNIYQQFINTVIDEVEEDTGLNPYSTSMEIYTTMDSAKQEHMYNIMSGKAFGWENEYVTAGVSVLDVKTGALVAVGTGRNNDERTFNNATMIKRQIGSTAKPLYDYTAGIEFLNWSTYTPFIDEPYSYTGGQSISNWDGKYKGFIQLRDALSQSRNVTALKAFKMNDNAQIRDLVVSMGLSPEIANENDSLHEAHAIGGYNGESPLSLSAAYAVYSNGGYYITPHSYDKVVFKDDNTVYEKEVTKTRVISEETAYMMCDLLKTAGSNGLGAYRDVNGAIYGAKHGTSNYAKETKDKWGFYGNQVNDLWVSSVSPDYAIAVWYGYEKIISGYSNVLGSKWDRLLWQTVAKGVFNAGSNWTQPAGVVSVTVEKETFPTALPSEFTPEDMKTTELFKVGTEPTTVSTRYSKLDNVTNLTGSITNSKLILTWNEIDTPETIDEAKIDEYYNMLYEDVNSRTAAKAARLAYNASTFGDIVYKIYSVDSDGNLNLIDTTDSNSATINVTSSSPDTYVVKTSYTIFTSNASDGQKITIDTEEADAKLTASLVGEDTLTYDIGDTINDSTFDKTSVNTMLDGEDSTSSAIEIKVTIKNSSDINVSSISTASAETYTVTYTITYKTQSIKLTRTLIIE